MLQLLAVLVLREMLVPKSPPPVFDVPAASVVFGDLGFGCPGQRLLIVQPVKADLTPSGKSLVCTDCTGAGAGLAAEEDSQLPLQLVGLTLEASACDADDAVPGELELHVALAVALECAAKHPRRISRVALVGTGFPMKVSPELLKAAQSREPEALRMINAWSHSGPAQYPGNPGPGSWVSGGSLQLMRRQKPGVLHADFAACDAYRDGFERAKQLQCPALFVLGSRDAMTPARAGRELARAIPSAWVKTLDGAGHSLMGEKPDDVLDALVEFLRA